MALDPDSVVYNATHSAKYTLQRVTLLTLCLTRESGAPQVQSAPPTNRSRCCASWVLGSSKSLLSSRERVGSGGAEGATPLRDPAARRDWDDDGAGCESTSIPSVHDTNASTLIQRSGSPTLGVPMTLLSPSFNATHLPLPPSCSPRASHIRSQTCLPTPTSHRPSPTRALDLDNCGSLEDELVL